MIREVLQRSEKLSRRLVEPAGKEQRDAYCVQIKCEALARAQAQESLKMRDIPDWAGWERRIYQGEARPRHPFDAAKLAPYSWSLILIMSTPHIGGKLRGEPHVAALIHEMFHRCRRSGDRANYGDGQDAPETATAAELKNMEQDLDAAGQLISRLQRELTDERHAYDAINARYTQMMGAAENLQHQIDAASSGNQRSGVSPPG